MTNLEVVAITIEDIEEINKSNAKRIILLQDFESGGATPDLEMVRIARSITDIPIRVLLRPRTDSYIYSDKDMQEVVNTIVELKALDIEGIVFSSLTDKGDINFKDLEKVINNKGNLNLSYGKAFDEIPEDKMKANFTKLSNYDVDTLMSSCQSDSEIYKELSELSLMKIMPSAGIKQETALSIAKLFKATFLHIASASRNEEGEICVEKINKLAAAL